MSVLREILERHADSGQKLSLEIFVPDRRESVDEEIIEQAYTLIKGSSESLRFLGELLIQFADGDYGCTLDIHPKGAGSAHFSADTELGIYLIKDPCEKT
jgi:hypothetical protein